MRQKLTLIVSAAHEYAVARVRAKAAEMESLKAFGIEIEKLADEREMWEKVAEESKSFWEIISEGKVTGIRL